MIDEPTFYVVLPDSKAEAELKVLDLLALVVSLPLNSPSAGKNGR